MFLKNLFYNYHYLGVINIKIITIMQINEKYTRILHSIKKHRFFIVGNFYSYILKTMSLDWTFNEANLHEAVVNASE